jgi:uncharacterized membrane protein YfcA
MLGPWSLAIWVSPLRVLVRGSGYARPPATNAQRLRCAPTRQRAILPAVPTAADDTEAAERTPAGHSRFAAIGLAGGFVGSLVGVGGGFVMVPLQVVWAGVGQHRAIGTALAAIAPVSLVGVAAYALGGGQVDFRLVLPLVAGSIVGAYLGSRVVSRLPEAGLRRVIAAILLVVGIKQLIFPG